VLWVKSAGNAYGRMVTTDITDNLIVTGYFISPTISFGSIVLTNSGSVNSGDVFIVKYTPTGIVLWAKSVGGVGDDRPNSVATDTSGNIVVVGSFKSQNIILGSTTLTNSVATNVNDLFILKYDSAGTFQWAKSPEGNGENNANSITTDVDGNIIVVGYFSIPNIIFGSDILNNFATSGQDMFIAKYNTSGTCIWAKSAGGNYGDYAESVNIDVYGNIIVVGYFTSSTLAFGSTTLTNVSSGNAEIFIANLGSLTVENDKVVNVDRFFIYPNPTKNILNIECSNLKANSNIEITNAYGQVVLSEKVTSGNAKVNMQHLPSGIYFAKITNANGVVEINKVVKR
jgi:hypothetical protein